MMSAAAIRTTAVLRNRFSNLLGGHHVRITRPFLSIAGQPTSLRWTPHDGVLSVAGAPLMRMQGRPNSSNSGDHDEFTKELEEDQERAEREQAEEDADLEVRDKILRASLDFVDVHGWSREALEAGAESLGYPIVTSGIVQNADIDLVHFHVQQSNLKLEQLMGTNEERPGTKPGQDQLDFLKKCVRTRLSMNVPYLSRWTEALAIQSYPLNAPASLHLSLEMVNTMWHLAGDTAVDMEWYSKRLGLLAVYKSTELAMMQDSVGMATDDFSYTWGFLDRRFSDCDNLGSVLTAAKVAGAVGTSVKVLMGLRR